MAYFMAPPTAVDGTTLQSVAGVIGIANGGVTATQLATSVAGAGLAGGGGTALSVNVDGTTLECPADTIGVKSGGVINSSGKTASGTSSSGTPGTAIASVSAATGFRLVAARILAMNAGATSDQRITATLSDNSTRTLDITGITNQLYMVDENGAWRIDAAGAPPSFSWSAAINLPIKSLASTTLAAGVAARYTWLSAVEVLA